MTGQQNVTIFLENLLYVSRVHAGRPAVAIQLLESCENNTCTCMQTLKSLKSKESQCLAKLHQFNVKSVIYRWKYISHLKNLNKNRSYLKEFLTLKYLGKSIFSYLF